MRRYKKYILRIRIKEGERDVLRFHWAESLETKIIEVTRFIRLAFGLTVSVYLLFIFVDERDGGSHKICNVLWTS